MDRHDFSKQMRSAREADTKLARIAGVGEFLVLGLLLALVLLLAM